MSRTYSQEEIELTLLKKIAEGKDQEISTLIARIAELEEALIDVKNRIENSDEWWMDDPDRGGFDLESITKALAGKEKL